MRKVALVFVVAVLAPSLVLAWLAVRSLRDQQFLIERQQSLLCQSVADSVVKEVRDKLAEYQREFSDKTAAHIGNGAPAEAAKGFDAWLRGNWPYAEVGFVVTLTGQVLAPANGGRPETREFLNDNSRFLANRESAEVYSNLKQLMNTKGARPTQQASADSQPEPENQIAYPKKAMRKVIPQQQASRVSPAPEAAQQPSKFSAAEAEFRQLIGSEMEGAVARFVDNRLSVLFWRRSARDPRLVFGVQLLLKRLGEDLQPLLVRAGDSTRTEDTCIALLNDHAVPVALSLPGFRAVWKRPFVATEIGELLPHWEVAVYLVDPSRLTQSAHVVKLTLGLVIAVLVLAIGIGSWLIVADLRRQLTLARQKTDFVSNVSHELKTPLTSIRMFAELLADARVPDPAKQRSYLGIIAAESARLTRLINNVLDFARIERGEKKYQFRRCDLADIARETAESYRPHLEAGGFQFERRLPESPLLVNGDRDALAQVLVNLLSNAEKYSGDRKEIELCVQAKSSSSPYAEAKVLDRGMGVPSGCESKIFEKFYRAHDSLSSGVPGSGLGLTLARQIARAHGGELLFERRQGGGSCFSLRLPVASVHCDPRTVSAPGVKPAAL